MPKGKNTPISDEEAEEWARRMVVEEEDLLATGSFDDWRDFVATKFDMERGVHVTPAQLGVLERGRMTGFEKWEEAGFGFETQIMPWGTQRVLRDIKTGRFMSASDAIDVLTTLRQF
ncbi:hypothetical protein ES703_25835 [subsurface metagenome]